MAENSERRTIDLGKVETTAAVASGGKIRVRHVYTVEQLEKLLALAREAQAGASIHSPTTAAQYDPPKRVFVKEGTPAWSAWLAYKRRDNPVWDLARAHVIDGKHFTGWWFPSLFPPEYVPAAPADSP